jgi:hypothetical protein
MGTTAVARRVSTDDHHAPRRATNGVASGHPASRERSSPVGLRRASRSGPGRQSMTSRQKRRARRTQESARQLRELQSQRRYLLPTQMREPDYWRDISVEIAGTIISALLIFSVGHIFGYIEHPSGRSELPRLLGLFAVLFAVGFALLRIRRVRLDHPGASSARLFRIYLKAIQPQWSLPTLAVGVLLGLGYF